MSLYRAIGPLGLVYLSLMTSMATAIKMAIVLLNTAVKTACKIPTGSKVTAVLMNMQNSQMWKNNVTINIFLSHNAAFYDAIRGIKI